MISFRRLYLADVSTRTGALPVRVELGLTGPVSPLSGMIVNLVEIDQDARSLISEFEKQKFLTADVAFEFLRDHWIRASERRELRASVVGLKGRFGEVRFAFDRAGERRLEWRLGQFAVNPATGLSGHVWAVAESRAKARTAVRQLASLKRFDLEFLSHQKWAAGVYAVGFRERKSKRELRLEP